jgi:hypothetical protein
VTTLDGGGLFRRMQPRINEVLQFPNDRVRIGSVVGKLRGQAKRVSFVPVHRDFPSVLRIRPSFAALTVFTNSPGATSIIVSVLPSTVRGVGHRISAPAWSAQS